MEAREATIDHLRKSPPTGTAAGIGMGLTMGRGGSGAPADMGALPREGRLTSVFHTITFFCAGRGPAPAGPGGPCTGPPGRIGGRAPGGPGGLYILTMPGTICFGGPGTTGLAPLAPLTGASLGRLTPPALNCRGCGCIIGGVLKPGVRGADVFGGSRGGCGDPGLIGPSGPIRRRGRPSGRPGGCLDWGPLGCLEGADEEPGAPPRACAAPFAACGPPFWADGRPRFRATAAPPSAPPPQKSTDESGRTSWKSKTSSSSAPTLFSAKCCSSRNAKADIPIVESSSWSTSPCLSPLRSSHQSAARVSSVHASESSELLEDEDLITSVLLSPSGSSSTSWNTVGSKPPSISITKGRFFSRRGSRFRPAWLRFSDRNCLFRAENEASEGSCTHVSPGNEMLPRSGRCEDHVPLRKPSLYVHQIRHLFRFASSLFRLNR